MYGIFNVTKFQDRHSFGIIATTEEDLISLNAKNFLYFNRDYFVPKEFNLVDILEEDDEFLNFITDIEVFVSVNQDRAKYLLPIIDSCIYIDDTNTKTMLQIAKDYKVKINEEDKNNNVVLVKALLMTFKKKQFNKMQPIISVEQAMPEETNSVKVIEIEEESVSEAKNESSSTEQQSADISIKNIVYIDGNKYMVDFSYLHQNRDLFEALPENINSFIKLVHSSSINQTNIDFINSVSESCGDNVQDFANLLKELERVGLFDSMDILKLKNKYLEQKENKTYQEYLSKSIERGVNPSVLQEQLDILIHLKS